MNGRNEIIAWSLLAPTPQCYYHQHSDSHIVYWQGIAMAKTQALIIVHENWIRCYSTPSMKEGAFSQFKRAYLLGAFGDVNWNNILQVDSSQHLSLLRKWLNKHNPKLFETLVKDHDIKDAMRWFDKDYETVI